MTTIVYTKRRDAYLENLHQNILTEYLKQAELALAKAQLKAKAAMDGDLMCSTSEFEKLVDDELYHEEVVKQTRLLILRFSRH